MTCYPKVAVEAKVRITIPLIRDGLELEVLNGINFQKLLEKCEDSKKGQSHKEAKANGHKSSK